MLRIRTRRHWIALVSGVVIAGASASAVIAAQFRESGVSPDLEAAIRDEPLVRVADIPVEGGLARHGVFVQPTSAGFLCLWDAPSATSLARQGGCNESDDPFAGGELFVSLAYDGGPAVADIKDARLIGLVASSVAKVELLMSNGARRAMVLRTAPVGDGTYRAFGYRFKRTDLRRGVEPTAVIALHANGAEVDRQTTGFGG